LDATHIPVLLDETLDALAPGRGGWFVDATLGLGGHAAALLERFPEARLLGLDRDPDARAAAALRLAPYGDRARIVAGNFHRLVEAVGDAAPVAGVLADLGVSSLQLDTAHRGFSFRREGPLDMRMGGSELTAEQIVKLDVNRRLRRDSFPRRSHPTRAGASSRVYGTRRCRDRGDPQSPPDRPALAWIW
jgi:16S rRNA (cytosine1402-N4)-methyltransferase